MIDGRSKDCVGTGMSRRKWLLLLLLVMMMDKCRRRWNRWSRPPCVLDYGPRRHVWSSCIGSVLCQ